LPRRPGVRATVACFGFFVVIGRFLGITTFHSHSAA